MPVLLFACTSFERFQTPEPPFAYIIKEVTVTNKIDNISLKGILTLPDTSDKFPVVILASGSGPNNYDEELFGHKPFWVLADYLTNHGIAVLRLNDRDYDKSPIEFYQNTTADFAKDIESAIQFIQTNEYTKNSPIGLVGHSEGGIVSSMVAAENSDVSFLILLGTPGLTMEKGNLLAATLSYNLIGTAENEIDRLLRFHEEYNQIVTNYQNDVDAKKQVEKLYDSYFKGTEAFSRKDKYNLVTKVTLPWYRYMNKNDPALYLGKIQIPVLAIIGEFDSQVVPEENLRAIEESLKSADNENFVIIKMDKLNHMLQPTDSYKNYSDIEQTMSVQLLEEINRWINKILPVGRDPS